ncbi:Alkane 1-monooxygenase 1 [Defluviimonas aquaemixtae]|uniref:Alkane 1-monooxygenase 1 n=1 Tax=Albidovulum aquaemixtae TaxID=1542388 RepID=A0A2R8B2A8_9RHOB|nr:fatty acid desaturase [Defluviimonas aquaemixtae]SPH16769.1 Alkane 1-monooxygenase 1 [Defluviimonas aquaemixtae]
MNPRNLLPWKRRKLRSAKPEAVAPLTEPADVPAPEPEDEELSAGNEAAVAAVMSVLSGNAPDAATGPTASPTDAPRKRAAKPDLRVVGESASTEPTQDAPTGPEAPSSQAKRARKVAKEASASRGQPAEADAPATTVKPKQMRQEDTQEGTDAALAAMRPARKRRALPRLRVPMLGLPRVQFDFTGWRPLAPFLVATLGPVPLLLLAGLLGGIWCLLALLSMTAVHLTLDEIAKRRGLALKRTETPEPGTILRAQRLSLYLAGLHFLMLPFAVWALSGAAGFGLFGWIATFLAFGLWFGQVSNSNAHELIHRSERWPFRAGLWVYISLLFGHHTSAHRLVHHRFVATTDDPNTAAEGENFYMFAARAWPGAFVAGYEMERNLREGREPGGFADLNPYWIYLAGGAAFVIGMGLAFGLDGLLAYLLLAAHAQLQLLLSDYVQHYGLLRRRLPSGALEPASLQHSWDAPHPVSGFMLLNGSRHSDHHAHPSRAYPALRLSPTARAPQLPHSLPVMATIALVPTLWHRLMDRRLAALKAGRAA